VSVECTRRNSSRPATVEWVEQMWGKHHSLTTDKLILVSKSGFTRPALAKAKWLGIGIYTLAEAEKLDWQSVIRNFKEMPVISILLPYVTKCDVIIDDDTEEELDPEKLKLPESILFAPDGKEIGNPLTFVKKLLAKPELLKKLEEMPPSGSMGIRFEHKFIQGVYLIDGTGTKRPVFSLQVEAKFRKEESTIKLEQASYGDIAVAHGEGQTFFGRPTQIVFTQQPNNNPSVVIKINNPKKS